MTGESDQITVYTSGTTMTVTDGVGLLYVDPATAVAALTITMPPNPSDQQRLRIVAGGNITAGTVITLLTISANTGQSLIGVSTAIFTVGGSMAFVFRRANSTWYRLQ